MLRTEQTQTGGAVTQNLLLGVDMAPGKEDLSFASKFATEITVEVLAMSIGVLCITNEHSGKAGYVQIGQSWRSLEFLFDRRLSREDSNKAKVPKVTRL